MSSTPQEPKPVRGSARRTFRRMQFAVLAAAAFAFLILWQAERYPADPAAGRPWQNAVYVWQTVWRESTATAVRRAASRDCAIMALVGEIHWADGRFSVRRTAPDWGALSQISMPVTAVLRADDTMTQALDQAGPEETARCIVEVVQETSAQAAQFGRQFSDIQLDYDCPTSKLVQYGRLIDVLRAHLPETQISITVLPTWLKTRAFRHVVRGAAYMVIQAHALEKPASAEQSLHLFDAARLETYLRRASSWRTPYYVALPTYGYGVVFDRNGDFSGLAAEGSPPALPEGYTIAEINADPRELAEVVNRLREDRPPFCLGAAWFRLPVETDTRNWSWETLEAVMDGRCPQHEGIGRDSESDAGPV